MTDLNKAFIDAALQVKTLPTKLDNDTLLNLYALYKQGSTGDVNGKRPGMFDFVAGAKYDAWEQLAGTEQSVAQQRYIDLVKKLQAT